MFLFKQKTAYEMRIRYWSSDVCSSDLNNPDEEVPQMTNKNIRASLLATVIVGMLSGSAIAEDRGPRQGEPPRINAATMGDQQSFSRFIVTYREIGRAHV